MKIYRLPFTLLISVLISSCTSISDSSRQASIIAEPVDSSIFQSEIKILNSGIKKSLVEVGDRFLFTNPEELWEVASIDGPHVIWHGSTGTQLVSSYNPFFPALQWISSTETGNRRIRVTDGGLFPLAEGAVVKFSVDGQSDRPPTSWRSEWSCQVEGKVEVVVPAGKSDAWRVLCHRNGQEELLFDFDETVGHVVQLASISGGQTIVRQLKQFEKTGSQQ